MMLSFQKVRGFSRNRQGAVAIEFAMVAPLLFLLIAWILEGSIIMFSQYTIQSAVESATRQVRTGSDPTGAVLREAVCTRSVFIRNCEARLAVWAGSAGTFGNIVVPRISALNPQGSLNYNIGGPGEAVAIVAVLDWNFAFPLLRFMSNTGDGNTRRLYGIAVFRNEPV